MSATEMTLALMAIYFAGFIIMLAACIWIGDEYGDFELIALSTMIASSWPAIAAFGVLLSPAFLTLLVVRRLRDA